MMKKIIPLFTTLLLLGWSMNAWSFACKTATGATIPIGGGSANVYVNLTPAVNVGQNLVVDLSTQIFCHNDYPETITDYVTLQRGSAYGGVLSSFSGTVKYNGTSYPFPTTTETARVIYDSRTDKPWPAVLYLTPVSTAGGVAITAGSLIAVLILHQTNNYNSDSFQFIWNIYANNDVVVPTGGCDVSARDVTVTLPDYPGSMAVPLTVHCAQSQQLGYYLSGTTADSANAIITRCFCPPESSCGKRCASVSGSGRRTRFNHSTASCSGERAACVPSLCALSAVVERALRLARIISSICAPTVITGLRAVAGS